MKNQKIKITKQSNTSSFSNGALHYCGEFYSFIWTKYSINNRDICMRNTTLLFVFTFLIDVLIVGFMVTVATKFDLRRALCNCLWIFIIFHVPLVFCCLSAFQNKQDTCSKQNYKCCARLGARLTRFIDCDWEILLGMIDRRIEDNINRALINVHQLYPAKKTYDKNLK